MGGAMFGDNLSFISDTTIAACNGQGCEMKDKFRENFWIALPAAAALALILNLSFRQAPGTPIVHEYHLLQTVPYLLVLIGGIAGIQVFMSYSLSVLLPVPFIMLGTGQTTLWDMLSSMGKRHFWYV